ncbi:MAG TPA: DUF533 domain-containing protein [Planctomycetota bacterium]|jgi:uncharacterized membrane protein YebE (DUF533 family)|nr:DUF533 domain-containing protein [Planctomycetota bacterium]
MLGDLFLGSIIRGALHARPKPFSRSMNYFGGGIPGIPGFHGGGMNLGMLLGAAGLAWGAYEHFKDRDPSVMTTVEGGGFASSGAPPPLPSTPPPLPTATAAAPGPDAIRRLVALTIAAARADGELGEEEYGRILAAAREHGAEKLVQAELAERRTVQEIVVGANDPRFAAQLYALGYGIVRADSSVSPAERKWLRELAAALNLDTENASRIEQETADRIDRQPS